MSNSHDPLQMIRRIDQLQNQVLEDLDSLNSRVENMIEIYYQNRSTAGLMPVDTPDGDGAVRESAA